MTRKITEHRNAGSETLSCRLTDEDRERIGQEIDIAGLDIAGLDIARIRTSVDELAEALKARKKRLEERQAEVFAMIDDYLAAHPPGDDGEDAEEEPITEAQGRGALSAKLAKAGYFIAPEEIELLGDDTQGIRRFAEKAPPFDASQPSPPEVPEELAECDLTQTAPLAELLLRMGYQILDADGEELEAVTDGFAADDDELNLVVAWAAAAWADLIGVGEDAGDPPGCLEPFELAPEDSEPEIAETDLWIGDSEDWEAIASTSPEDAAEIIEKLKADGKRGLARLREIAEGFETLGGMLVAADYSKANRATCARDILQAIRERHEDTDFLPDEEDGEQYVDPD